MKKNRKIAIMERRKMSDSNLTPTGFGRLNVSRAFDIIAGTAMD